MAAASFPTQQYISFQKLNKGITAFILLCSGLLLMLQKVMFASGAGTLGFSDSKQMLTTVKLTPFFLNANLGRRHLSMYIWTLSMYAYIYSTTLAIYKKRSKTVKCFFCGIAQKVKQLPKISMYNVQDVGLNPSREDSTLNPSDDDDTSTIKLSNNSTYSPL